MDSIATRVVTFILALFILIYVGFQVFQQQDSSLKTERAISYTVQDVEKAQGLIIRDESVIARTAAGVLSYFSDDGVKVTYGTPIAEVYATKEDVLNRRRVLELEQEMKQLSELERPGNNYYLNSDAITKQINENLYGIIRQNETGNLTNVSTYKSELLANLNKKQLATGVISNFSEKTSRLTAEKESIERKISGNAAVIEADRVGYFSSFVDGMEQTLTIERASTMDSKQIEKLLEQEYTQDDSKIGKLIEQRPWNFIFIKNAEDAELMYEGMRLNVDFGIPNYDNVPATVKTLREEPETGKVIVTLSCNYFCSQLTRMRNPTVELNYQVYKGLKIPTQAVRFKNDQRGVYVDTGSEVVFKTLDVIYEGQGYVLSEIDRIDSKKVQPNDDVVVSGVIPERILAQDASSTASAETASTTAQTSSAAPASSATSSAPSVQSSQPTSATSDASASASIESKPPEQKD